MIKKPQFWILFAGFGVLLGLSVWLSPVWYDDAGHYIVVREAVANGKFAYPHVPELRLVDPESPFITMGFLLNYPAKWWMQAFGTEMWKVRILVAVLSFLGLWVFAGMAKSVIREEKVFWALLLVAGNIQLVTYGAELLGEVPMLLFVFAGLWMLQKGFQQERGGILFTLPSVFFWLCAIWIKEYIAVPIGLGLLFAFIGSLFHKPSRKKALRFLLPGILLPLLAGLRYWWVYGPELTEYFTNRASYGSEFLALNPIEALRFLAFKPLIWLGAIALFVKMKVAKQPKDWLMAAFFVAQLLFFLLSAGYDRFGFQLLFIPAIYLAEFVWALWKRLLERPKWWKQAAFVLGFLLIFTQQTFWIFGKRLINPSSVNASEKCIAQWITEESKGRTLVTFDQQIIPFIPEDFDYRLAPCIPSAVDQYLEKAGSYRFSVGFNEVYVEGPYGKTYYEKLVDTGRYKHQLNCDGSDPAYTLFYDPPYTFYLDENGHFLRIEESDSVRTIRP